MKKKNRKRGSILQAIQSIAITVQSIRKYLNGNIIRPILITNNLMLIPNRQFGFIEQHSSIDQIYETFLNISQAFDGLWHYWTAIQVKKKIIP